MRGRRCGEEGCRIGGERRGNGLCELNPVPADREEEGVVVGKGVVD